MNSFTKITLLTVILIVGQNSIAVTGSSAELTGAMGIGAELDGQSAQSISGNNNAPETNDVNRPAARKHRPKRPNRDMNMQEAQDDKERMGGQMNQPQPANMGMNQGQMAMQQMMMQKMQQDPNYFNRMAILNQKLMQKMQKDPQFYTKMMQKEEQFKQNLLIDEPNQLDRQTLDKLNDNLNDLNRKSHKELESWKKLRDQRRDSLLNSIEQIAKEELEFIKGLAEEEGAVKTTAAIDGLIKMRKSRYKDLKEEMSDTKSRSRRSKYDRSRPSGYEQEEEDSSDEDEYESKNFYQKY